MFIECSLGGSIKLSYFAIDVINGRFPDFQRLVDNYSRSRSAASRGADASGTTLVHALMWLGCCRHTLFLLLLLHGPVGLH